MTTEEIGNPTLLALASSRRIIVDRLKRDGEATAERLAGVIGISTTGARQHLAALQKDGLVSVREVRDGRGRPKHMFSLTAWADSLFPRNYSQLTNELLAYVEDEDPDLVRRIFDRRAERRLREARSRMQGLSFRECVAVLAKILDEDGYLADFTERDDGVFVITEHNCAVLNVARRYGHACGSELEFLKGALPGAEVVRSAHRLTKGHICSYEIRPAAAEGSAA